MSFLYKYKIIADQEEQCKKDVYIEIYTIIEITLREKLADILKDIYYLNDGTFEFKSFYSISNMERRNIGKAIKAKLSSNIVNKSNYKGIRIQDSKMIMYVEVNEEDGKKFASIELISSDILQKGNKNYDIRCNEYYKKFGYSGTKKINKELLYADVLVAEDIDLSTTNVLRYDHFVRGVKWLLVNVRHIDKVVQHDKNTLNILHLENTQDKKTRLEARNILYFKVLRSMDEKNIKKVCDAIKLDADSNIDIESTIDVGSRINFSVHNVGQALATSVSIKDSLKPIIFFDLAWYGQGNLETKEKIVNQINSAENQIPIFISHLHQDHYNLLRKIHGIARNKLNVYYISKQFKLEFNKIMNNIRIEGGTYTQLSSSKVIKINNLYTIEIVPCGPGSYLKKKRTSLEHQRGLIMLINKLDVEENIKKLCVFVSGDENYDCITNYNDLGKNIDDILSHTKVLVASHHGGSYYYDEYTIPENSIDEHKIIYSCGDKNRYHHPSKSVCQAYMRAGWQCEDTVNMSGIKEDYTIEL